jgi:hypothetical protein
MSVKLSFHMSNYLSYDIMLLLIKVDIFRSPLMIPTFPLGISKGVGFIRFDQRHEAERAIKQLNGTIPEGATEPITVKFANSPSSNKNALPIPPVAAQYLTPTRRFLGPIHHPAGRFR